MRRAIDELEQARTAASGADEILLRCRDLQFERHGNQYAAEDAAHDLPERTARYWSRHLEIRAEGYAALSRR